MVDWIKCVPFVGTTISVCEMGKAIYERNSKKALWKLGETVVGATMDTVTVLSVGSTVIASTSAKTAAKVTIFAIVKKIAVSEAVVVAGATVGRAIITTVTGKEADKCDYVNRAEGGSPRWIVSDTPNEKIKRQLNDIFVYISSNVPYRVITDNGGREPNDEVIKWSGLECEGDKPDDKDELTDHDKTKAKLNKDLPDKVIPITGKESDKYGGSCDGDFNTAEGSIIMRQAAIDAQRWLQQKLVLTSNSECECDKLDDNDVLTDHDKTKAKLNRNLPERVKTVRLLIHGPISEVSYKIIDGHSIVHYSRSIVTKKDLREGKDVTDDDRKIIEEIGISSKESGEVYMDFNKGKGYYFGWGWNPHPNIIKSNKIKLCEESDSSN